MYDVIFGEVEVPKYDLLHVPTGLVLREPLLDDLAEIVIAELGDDIGIILGGEDIVEGEYMRHALEFLEHLNLTIEEDPVDVVLEHLEIDDLDCHWLAGVVIAALVDMAGVALAYDVVETVGVVLDFLAGVTCAHRFLIGLEIA